jgi:hypothetical protein
VLTPDRAEGDRLRALGAHVARGRFDDHDLIERACQNVRTIVFGDRALTTDDGEALFFGGRNAKVGRWVYCVSAPRAEVAQKLRGWDAEHVVLATSRGLLRGEVDAARVAEAIDAADDLAGEVRLELDLREGSAWRALKLEPS